MTFTHVGEWLARREQLTPEKVGLVDVETQTRLTYRMLNLRARALAILCSRSTVYRRATALLFLLSTPQNTWMPFSPAP